MRRASLIAPIVACVGALIACTLDEEREGPPDVLPGDAMAPAVDADAGADAATVQEDEAASAGRATAYVFDQRAFERPAATMSAEERSAWIVGQATFQLEWTAKTGTDRSGLGPTFNALSCEACHAHNGRGAPPLVSGDALVSSLLRISGADGYGDQLQHLANAGVPPEGRVHVDYAEERRAYADGTEVVLLRPVIVLEPALGALPSGASFSLRLASQTFGAGFLEAITDADLLAHEDPNDADGDGISGRANRVLDQRRGVMAIGRFGWKASRPTVEEQTAAAFAGDIGITSALFPQANCPPSQAACGQAAGVAIELTDTRLAATTTFMRGTTVPARRDVDAPEVRAGKRLFDAMRCSRCHVPAFTTGGAVDAPFLAHETIRPYTNLLLHDLGEGLADHRADGEASGSEWRTPPLWGLGLLREVSGHGRLLHDGRARDESEAILWHDGEAREAAESFRNANASDRHALLAFLRSL